MTDYSKKIILNKKAAGVFEAINNVRDWWNSKLTGHTHTLHDEFAVQFGDMHYSRQKISGLVPAKSVTWIVTESNLSFASIPDEWTGTRIHFDIAEENGKTVLTFTHFGLQPKLVCYKSCSGGWDYYLRSLEDLINSGKGQPE